MASFKHILFASACAALGLAASTSDIKTRSETITDNQTGNYGGYYFSKYVETGSNTFTIGTGTYNLQWTSANTDVVAGIGWATGAARSVCHHLLHQELSSPLCSTINYSGFIDADNDSLIAFYGWTAGPLVEYYVIETYGTYNPGSAGIHLGTVRHRICYMVV
jgi:endo-1,4-beta-xylanase